ncbi:MAG: Hpt domain-containing protein [Deltaproteobacteria bacterium]|nr:Hpt domain-containing protein [Deltaproteobacteria bacterium]MCB9479212.1 Hpt domain-containing protein [Deltaproteobacteria bacterium]MCB9490050.1 Hpt domain-containing protein [Deltaproteobacteria bacterium]
MTAPDTMIRYDDLVAKFMNDKEYVDDKLASFARDLREKGDELERAVAERRFEKIALMAHSLSGEARLLGMDAFVEPLRTLSQGGLHDDPTGLDGLMDRVRALRDRYWAEYEALVRRSGDL